MGEETIDELALCNDRENSLHPIEHFLFLYIDLQTGYGYACYIFISFYDILYYFGFISSLFIMAYRQIKNFKKSIFSVSPFFQSNLNYTLLIILLLNTFFLKMLYLHRLFLNMLFFHRLFLNILYLHRLFLNILYLHRLIDRWSY